MFEENIILAAVDVSYEEITGSSKNAYESDDLFQLIEHVGVRDLHFKHDPETGLKAIVAIHSIKSGSSLGGCRCIEYPSTRAAAIDAMRLARGMTYKSAISNTPYGGSKAVIMKPPEIRDRKEFFAAFARFVHELGGRYITAKDSGTTVADMDLISTITPYVTSVSSKNDIDGDPSPFTAYGMLKGIEACVKYKLNRDSLDGLHVAIQGVGYVGYDLAKLLHAKGVRLTVTDIDEKALRRCEEEFGAVIVHPNEIYSIACDIFAPCALGAILNDKTIPQLRAKIVAGSANNQLALERYGLALRDRDILYAPDFAINSGGLIQAVALYRNEKTDEIMANIDFIYHRLLEIFERADREGRATNKVAIDIAKEHTLAHEER